MSPIPIGNPDTALRLTVRYDLKGKVGLQHDEIVVPISLLEDLTPAPPELEVETIAVNASPNTTAEVDGTGPSVGMRRQVRHISVAIRFTQSAAAGDVAVGSLVQVAALTNAMVNSAILEAGAAPFANDEMEIAVGTAVNFSILGTGTAIFRVRADALGSSVGVGARVWYWFYDEPLVQT